MLEKVMVHRRSRLTWSVAGGPEVRELVAVAAVVREAGYTADGRG